ncbi:unnamed protein product, partial [Closterium sp. NIES-53]
MSKSTRGLPRPQHSTGVATSSSASAASSADTDAAAEPALNEDTGEGDKNPPAPDPATPPAAPAVPAAADPALPALPPPPPPPPAAAAAGTGAGDILLPIPTIPANPIPNPIPMPIPIPIPYIGHGACAWRTGSSCPHWLRRRFLAPVVRLRSTQGPWLHSSYAGSPTCCLTWESSLVRLQFSRVMSKSTRGLPRPQHSTGVATSSSASAASSADTDAAAEPALNEDTGEGDKNPPAPDPATPPAAPAVPAAADPALPALPPPPPPPPAAAAAGTGAGDILLPIPTIPANPIPNPIPMPIPIPIPYIGHGACAWRTGSSCPHWLRRRFLAPVVRLRSTQGPWLHSSYAGSPTCCLTWESSLVRLQF